MGEHRWKYKTLYFDGSASGLSTRAARMPYWLPQKLQVGPTTFHCVPVRFNPRFNVYLLLCAQISLEPADTHLCHVDEADSVALSYSTSLHLPTSLCDAATTSLYDSRMTSSEHLQRRPTEKTILIDSDASDCHDDLVYDMKLLDVDIRTTTLPDLVTTNDAVHPDAPIRRRPGRSRLSTGSGGSDKTRRKASSAMSHSSSVTTVAVRSQLTCNSRLKRKARVHAVCWQTTCLTIVHLSVSEANPAALPEWACGMGSERSAVVHAQNGACGKFF